MTPTSLRKRRVALALLIIACFAFFFSACSPATFLPVVENPPTNVPDGTEENTPEPEFISSLPLVIGGPSATPEPGIPSPTVSPASPTSSFTTTPFEPLPTDTPTTEGVRFAVIGDYGLDGQGEADVAALVKIWEPDFVITVGDNNYPAGSRETIDDNIGQYYQEFIYPYKGEYGPGAEENRFFPTLGNHDWDSEMAQPYFDYFNLPGNERYYDFVWGPVHLFALDSDSREPDGVGSSSVQADWLEERLATSTTPWQLVYAHHPPYTSGYHGTVSWMRWPFQEWGADTYLAGHEHGYERILLNDFPYIINGLGGGAIYGFLTPIDGSQVRYSDDYGAMLVEADEERMQFEFINRSGDVIDTFELVEP